ncbi:MAG: 30S ribosomal protein S19 [Candidatus Parvarchaeota archaeon]|nr:30S ribosomal protein S19 [Candidatus Parvarchaeota archaeon]MCW1301707.1 30S ribosomal protein S19 [Candidatus Parvarchaeota archaeon]
MEEKKFRGKSIGDLSNMQKDELLKVVNSDLRRRLKRNFTDQEKKLIDKIERSKKTNKPVRTHLREMFILPSFVGLTINVHNGKEFVPVEIKPNMVFHRLGEFAITVKQVKHGTPGLSATRSSSFVPIK